MSPRRARHTHSLDALLVHTDAPEQGFKDFAEREGEEADGAKLQMVSHLLQDGRRFLLNLLGSPARFFGHLPNSK